MGDRLQSSVQTKHQRKQKEQHQSPKAPNTPKRWLKLHLSLKKKTVQVKQRYAYHPPQIAKFLLLGGLCLSHIFFRNQQHETYTLLERSNDCHWYSPTRTGGESLEMHARKLPCVCNPGNLKKSTLEQFPFWWTGKQKAILWPILEANQLLWHTVERQIGCGLSWNQFHFS